MSDHHDHDHDHVEDERPASEYELLEQALRELLIEKGVFSATDLNRTIDNADSKTPASGSAVVARAWTDTAYKERLLNNPKDACRELGFDPGPALELKVMENTATLRHVIVCTLCSCYPRALLGLPPAWYKSIEYRSRVVVEPRAVLLEFGTDVSDDVEIKVVDSTADVRYMVLPTRPPETNGWSENDLAALVTRDCLVGVVDPGVTDVPDGRAAIG
jgi:hypothetical protein